MKKILLTTFVLALFWSTGFTQAEQQTDSLKHRLAIESEDTSRVFILADICAAYRFSNSDSAIYYGEKAIALANKIQFYKGKILALGFESMTLSDIGNLPVTISVKIFTSEVHT